MTDHPARYRPDWYPDPMGRFDLRYHNGSAWTSDVASDGRRYVDQPEVTGTGAAGRHDAGPTLPDGAGRLPTAALVLGICGLATAWIPFVFVIGAVCAVLAVVFGIVSLRRLAPSAPRRGAAIAGLVTGGVAGVAAVGGLFFTIAASNAFDAYENPGPYGISLDVCDRTDGAWNAGGVITNVSDTSRSYTVRVVFVRSGTDNVQAAEIVILEDVGPGENRAFEARRASTVENLECDIASVNGPRPFGIAVD